MQAPRLDAGEDIRVELVPRARLPELVRTGAITHALVLVSLYLAGVPPPAPERRTMSPALLLALVVGAAPPAENVAAKAGPILFGGGDRVYLLLAPYQPGATLTVATVRLTHPEVVAGRSWDDAGYRFATGADPAALRVAAGTALHRRRCGASARSSPME